LLLGSGKPAKCGNELRDRIAVQLTLPPLSGMASWDGSSLALEPSVSDETVVCVVSEKWHSKRAAPVVARQHNA
jgi:hypothetical protein